MSDNYSPLPGRWFNLATDVCRTYVKGLILVQERTIDITRAMLNQVDAVAEQAPNLVQELNTEFKRTRLLVAETKERYDDFRYRNKFAPRRLNGNTESMKELPAPSQTQIKDEVE